jgi:hypothetical protein
MVKIESSYQSSCNCPLPLPLGPKVRGNVDMQYKMVIWKVDVIDTGTLCISLISSLLCLVTISVNEAQSWRCTAQTSQRYLSSRYVPQSCRAECHLCKLLSTEVGSSNQTQFGLQNKETGFVFLELKVVSPAVRTVRTVLLKDLC